MEKFKKTSVLICNILCAVLLLFILICQFVPYWRVQDIVTDQASLIGITGRQYKHWDMIESLNIASGGFTYHDISTQVLVIIVASAFGLLKTLRGLQKTGNGLFGMIVALFGLHLWVTVPAFTLGTLGTVLYYAFVALLIGSAYLLFNYLLEKVAGDDNQKQADPKKQTIATIAMAVVFSLIFVIFASNTKGTIDKKADDRKISDAATKQQITKLEGDIAQKDAIIKGYEDAATEPDVSEPDVSEPDVSEPDVTEPDVTEPDVTEPDVTEPDVTEPDVTEPDVTEPDVTEPDVTEPDVTEPDDDESEIALILKEYVVQDGDNLYDICVENGIDYNKYIRLITYINNIPDPDALCVGQVLLLPYIEKTA